MVRFFRKLSGSIYSARKLPVQKKISESGRCRMLPVSASQQSGKQ